MKRNGIAALAAALVLASASAAVAQSYVYSQTSNSHYARGSSGWDGASRESFGG